MQSMTSTRRLVVFESAIDFFTGVFFLFFFFIVGWYIAKYSKIH